MNGSLNKIGVILAKHIIDIIATWTTLVHLLYLFICQGHVLRISTVKS